MDIYPATKEDCSFENECNISSIDKYAEENDSFSLAILKYVHSALR